MWSLVGRPWWHMIPFFNCCRFTFRLMPLADNELLYRPYTLGELHDVRVLPVLLHAVGQQLVW